MVKRKDEWLDWQDSLLAESVIAALTAGTSQLDVFKKVGEEIGRTAGSCKFRWEKFLKQKYGISSPKTDPVAGTMGYRFRLLRDEMNLTQKQVAEATGIAEHSYKSYEINMSQPPSTKLLQIADFYCVSVDYLLGRTPDRVLPKGRTISGADMMSIMEFGGLIKALEFDAGAPMRSSYFINRLILNDGRDTCCAIQCVDKHIHVFYLGLRDKSAESLGTVIESLRTLSAQRSIERIIFGPWAHTPEYHSKVIDAGFVMENPKEDLVQYVLRITDPREGTVV